MGATEATLRGLLVSSLACAGLACRPAPRAGAPAADAGTVVTVYIPQAMAQTVLR